MTERSRVLLGSARATTGLVIAGVAAVAALVVGNATLPVVTTDPLAITVDTEQASIRQVVCAGSFAELGADPDRPTVAIPTGSASVQAAGDAGERFELARDEAGSGGLPITQQAADGVIGAAQWQDVDSEKVRGRTASACAEPVNEQWIVGGSTAVGVSSTLSLGNPSEVPATVQIAVYAEDGQVESSQTTGVLVPPQSERTVSLNGYAPDRESLAVQVVSTGATVTASMGVGHTVDIRPYAADTVSRQLEPLNELVIPGPTTMSDHEAHHEGEHGLIDDNPVQVRLLAPGEEEGRATISALTESGEFIDLGHLDLNPDEAQSFIIETWPEDAQAVHVASTVPVVAGALGSAQEGSTHDYAWFAPAPEISANTPTAAPIVRGGQLILVNTGELTAEVSISGSDADDDPTVVEVAAGAAVIAKAPADAVLTSDEPIHAGVRVADDTEMAGYPVLPLTDRGAALTVYPR